MTFKNFVLPPKSQVGVISPDIAGEGVKVILSDGEQITYNPPPPKPVMPDWSEIKSIRHYFNRTGYRVYPAWLYHPTEAPRIVKNQDEAAELGVCYREASVEERGRYGLTHVWDWAEDSKWRPTQHNTGPRVYDPRHPELGKEFIPTPMSHGTANRELLNTVLPEVTAAVVAALKQGGSVNPSNVDPKQWGEFLAFQAWKKTQEAIDVVAAEVDAEQTSTLSEVGDERQAWEAEAERKGIKVDHRWSLDTLKERVQRAA